MEKMKKFIVLLEEEAKLKKTPLELSNDSNVITFIISIINDILIYNLTGDKYYNILIVLKKNLIKHPTLLFIDTLDYLTKDNEKLHIVLFLEFSNKTIDSFFDKMQQNRNVLLFFTQEKNSFFINYLQYCIELFRCFRNINFIVKSAVLDQYNNFLRFENRNSNRYGFIERNSKRSSTPDVILGILDTKYQWKINTKNLSVSPCRVDGPRQFFANDHYHKKKNSSFANKIKNKPKHNPLASFTHLNSNESVSEKKKKISKLEQQLKKQKALLNSFKQTNELFKKINEDLTEEIHILHCTIKSQLKDQDLITDATKQSKEDFEKSLRGNINTNDKTRSRPKSENIQIPLEPSFESLGQLNMTESLEYIHYKKNSRTNKLSFGQKSLSHEKFDSFHNTNAISPKFEGNETVKSFNPLNPHNAVSEFSGRAKRIVGEPLILESDGSYFE